MLTATDLPPLNPFPVQATTSIEEGSFVRSYLSWADTTPTLTVESVRRLTVLAQRFRNSTDDQGRATGQAVFVYGPHGAGKTHAIRAAIGLATTEVDQPTLLPLYVKLSSPNVVNAYRRLMSQLSIADLTRLALRFLGSLTAAAGPSLSGPLEERLREDPAALLTMFNDHVVERGLLLQAQADRLRAVVTGELDFQRALTYLLEPDLKDAAYGWLQGRTISDQALRQLGLSGHLDTPDQCRYGLQLLTLICARAGQPLVLILDQAEKFLAKPDGQMITDSIGFLHSLVEAVPDLGGMLVVAANDVTWATLPTDLRQRFGTNDIFCAPAQPGQAFELLGLYILAAFPAGPPQGYRAPRPFTEPAVHKLLRNSGGNLRSLLQLAWQSFDGLTSGEQQIDVAHVPDEEIRYDRSAVDASVRRALWHLGQPGRDPREGFQYAVSVGGNSRLLIRIREAMFYLDETDRAEEDIRVRAEVIDDGGAPVLDRHVLIVIGYASSEVLHLLGQVYDDVLVYRDDASLGRQLAILAGQVGLSRTVSTPDDYLRAQDRLAQMGWSRNQAAGELGGNVADVAQRDAAERAVRRYEDLRERWSDERERLTAAISAARRERLEADLDEWYRVTTAYRRRRLLRTSVFVAVLPLLFVLGVVGVGLGGYAVAISLLEVASIGAAAVVITLVASIGALRLESPRPASLSEVDRIVRDRFRQRSQPVGVLRAAVLGSASPQYLAGTPADLRSPDPYRRYACLLLGLRRETSLQLSQALRTERVNIIRRALAGRLGAFMSEQHSDSLSGTLADTDPADLPYLMERFRSPQWSEVVALPASMRVLAAIGARYGGRGQQAGRSAGLRRAEQEALRERDTATLTSRPRPSRGAPEDDFDPAVRLVLATALGGGALSDAYTNGLTLDRLLRALDATNDHDLHRAASLLSPFHGLGANDHLALVDEVERLYVFVAQLLFFVEGGIIPPQRLA
ncbi:myosin/kinesin family protein [Micromonospora profundi]|uniref:hypothetical protein n=1 Tax=Micromonospora profundi TaxID=1420889 RepID=UPI0036A7F2AC